MRAEPDSDFYARAERRLWWWQLGLGAAGVAAALARWGFAAAAGFGAGAAISILNFYWLKQGIDATTAAASGRETPEARRKRRRLIWKFLARYLLMALAAYGILKYTRWNVAAFLAGLFLFAAAILAEICLEVAAELMPEIGRAHV